MKLKLALFTYCEWFISAFTFTFMHLADAFIQSDLHCIQVTVFYILSALLSFTFYILSVHRSSCYFSSPSLQLHGHMEAMPNKPLLVVVTTPSGDKRHLFFWFDFTFFLFIVFFQSNCILFYFDLFLFNFVWFDFTFVLFIVFSVIICFVSFWLVLLLILFYFITFFSQIVFYFILFWFVSFWLVLYLFILFYSIVFSVKLNFICFYLILFGVILLVLFIVFLLFWFVLFILFYLICLVSIYTLVCFIYLLLF